MVKTINTVSAVKITPAGAAKIKGANSSPSTKTASDAKAKKSNSSSGGASGNPMQALMSMMAGGGGNKAALMQAMMKMMSGAAAGGAVGNAADDVKPGKANCKMVLHQAHGIKLGRMLKRDEEISYATSQVADGDSTKWQSTCTVSGSQYAGECGNSKQKAEVLAAKAALDDLYPDAQSSAALKLGRKRKAAEAETHPRQQLNHCIALVNGQITKDDLTITTEGGDGSFTTTLVLNFFGKKKVTGTGSNKKEAEASACKAALANPALKAKFSAAESQHAAKKDERNKAKMSKFKETHSHFFEAK